MDTLVDACDRFSLEDVTEDDILRHRLRGKTVRIWSGQWGAWWRAESCGYTKRIDGAGVYTFEDAYQRSGHLRPEKQIIYELVE